MFFMTYDPYNDHQSDNDNNLMNSIHDKNKNSNVCFICLEDHFIHESLVTLNQIKKYEKSCSCDLRIHRTCLDKWYFSSNKCPICRVNIGKNHEFKNRFRDHFYCIQLIMTLFKMVRIVFFVLMFYYLYKQAIDVRDKQKNQQHYQYHYQHHYQSMDYYYYYYVPIYVNNRTMILLEKLKKL